MKKQKPANVPLTLPIDLHSAIRSAAKATHLSQADVMRQGLYIGVPELVSRMRPKPANKAGK